MKKLFTAVCLLLTLQAQSQNIRIISLVRETEGSGASLTGEITITADFKVPVDSASSFFTSSGSVRQLAESYKNLYPILNTYSDSTGTYCIFRKSYQRNVRKPNNSLVTTTDIQQFLETKWAGFQTLISNFTPTSFDAIIGTSLIGETWQPSN